MQNIYQLHNRYPSITKRHTTSKKDKRKYALQVVPTSVQKSKLVNERLKKR